jgi:bifunctional non-homologous end joining protein LigD
MAKVNKPAKDGAKKPAVDRQLDRYRSMRDFKSTAEPSGTARKPSSKASKKAGNTGLPFVIQKHAATRLHYDFRLGWNGVLKSWAVTKGPSYFTGDKRLAVQVEDHPAEYGGFEGTIPKGQYGGGTVMLWDRGTWEPLVDVGEGLKKGNLKFALHGERLKGKWVLVRMNGRAANESKPNWLLIKEHDEMERRENQKAVTDEFQSSVASGRSMDEIARAQDRVWDSTSGEENTKTAKRGVVKTSRRARPADGRPRKNGKSDFTDAISDAPKEKLPAFIAPQLASLAKTPPPGDGWLHELKLDGYRIQARFDRAAKNTVQLLTRTGLDWTHRMKSIAEAVATLPAQSALLDGEVVVLTSDGLASFAALQAAFQDKSKEELTYFVFDLLHLDGRNLRGLPLVERKRILTALLEGNADEGLRLSEDIDGDGAHIFSKACDLGAEGIISKLGRAKYSSGRSGAWQKLKCYLEQELIIGGFTLPSNGTYGVGALLLGYYRDGKLVYAGRTGTGFTQKTHRMMRDRLEKLIREGPAFDEIPRNVRRGVRWVRPDLVAQISFAAWTADHLVRQAAFKGLREDKPAKEVTRETPGKGTGAASPPDKKKASASHKPKTYAAARTATPPTSDNTDLPIRLTHPEKTLDSVSGLTKEQLARYYLAVSERMLPHIAGRPLTLVRCPEGSGKPCFYQKHSNQMLPADFKSIDVVDKKTGKPEPYITLSTTKAIVELAQVGVLEIHPWGSRNDSLEKPDRIVFDLDPDAAIPWKTLAAAADEVRRRLSKIGLESFLKTTGGHGLHVVVPIRAEHLWAEVKQFAHEFAQGMERDEPSLYLTKMTKAARKGKIYLDYLRNERGATSIAPYSPRAREGAPVALPLKWSELKAQERPRFLVSDLTKWKKRLEDDPWSEMPGLKQRLSLPR